MSRTFGSMTVVLALLGTAIGGEASTSRASAGSDSIAVFEGEYIDLSKGWGAARACLVAESAGVVECFRGRAKLLERERRLALTAVAGGPRPFHIPSFTTTPADPKGRRAIGPGLDRSCLVPLRLYANAAYGGRELDFYDRALWQNLSDWGFDNQTSSYRVGSCGVDLADRANGTAPFVSGKTTALHDEPLMPPGWDNRVSSIHIA